VRPVEGQALAWVRPQKLGGYAMPPADKPLVAMLRDFTQRLRGESRR
jgi:8-oxo-dGTP diphosphatase